MRNYNRNYWWLFLLFFVFIGGEGIFDSIVPLVIMIIAVAAIAFAAVNSSKKAENAGGSRRSFRSSSSRSLSPDQRARINVFLRRYFQQRPALRVSDSFTLRLHGSRYQSLTSLDVYRGGSYLSDFDSFASRYPDTYEQMIGTLLQMARGQEAVRDDVVDVEATEHVDQPEQKQETEQTETNTKTVHDAQYFIDEINRLNEDIPDKEISDSLYETCALLKQIQQLQKKFPDSASKLEKLYAYYLPILLKILNQYDTLQSVTSDPNFAPTKQKLTKTIALINQAMKTIISSMTDQDFINLSADISTLEAVLQKDGLAGDAGMEMPSGEDDSSRKV
ncbi:MAG: hypothetical protein SOI44_06025 [Lactimicrobium sp.]|jgi:hypothetical protein|uniref:hypothetical protein n=1 Tax=Lactimicrobium sp. TaxID=2563780 RepID=UPI002F35B7AC